MPHAWPADNLLNPIWHALVEVHDLDSGSPCSNCSLTIASNHSLLLIMEATSQDEPSMEVSWSHGIPKETYLAGNTQNVNKISATDSRGPVLTILRRKAG